MKFNCLVSTSPTRKPIQINVTAEDDAEAAFLCWLDRAHTGRAATPGSRRPVFVDCTGDKCTVTDGRNFVKVHILSQTQV